jgi:hypothetical protein
MGRANIKAVRDSQCAAKEFYDEENSDSNGSCGHWYKHTHAQRQVHYRCVSLTLSGNCKGSNRICGEHINLTAGFVMFGIIKIPNIAQPRNRNEPGLWLIRK